MFHNDNEEKHHFWKKIWDCWLLDLLVLKLCGTQNWQICIHHDAPIQPLVVITKPPQGYNKHLQVICQEDIKKQHKKSTSHMSKNNLKLIQTLNTSFHLHCWFVSETFLLVFHGCQASYDSNTQCPSWSPQSPPEDFLNSTLNTSYIVWKSTLPETNLCPIVFQTSTFRGKLLVSWMVTCSLEVQ